MFRYSYRMASLLERPLLQNLALTFLGRRYNFLLHNQFPTDQVFREY
jgi:hypothetical protein